MTEVPTLLIGVIALLLVAVMLLGAYCWVCFQKAFDLIHRLDRALTAHLQADSNYVLWPAGDYVVLTSELYHPKLEYPMKPPYEPPFDVVELSG